MRFNNQQLTLWYGTSDAPAPLDGKIEARRGVVVVVAVQPAHSCNAVTVRVPRRRRPGPDRPRGSCADRCRATRRLLPGCVSGLLDRRPGGLRANRDLLGAHGTGSRHGDDAPFWFRLGGPVSAERVVTDVSREPATQRTPSSVRLPFSLDYLASVHIRMKEPEAISETPEGIVVNWFWAPAEGVVAGPKVNAKIRQLDGDRMTVRRDGVGAMGVRATLETRDGALVFVNSLGHYELGEDGYQDVLAGRWPARITTRTTPRFHTAHPQDPRLNRLHCVGMGQLEMRQLRVHDELHAVR